MNNTHWMVNEANPYKAHHHPRVGEVCLINSQRAMCINSFIQYGGGSGPLWAVEHQRAQFALKSHRGYIEGVCRRVHPKSKSVTLEITKGPTWGILAMATLVTIEASEFIRYHPACESGIDFVFESEQQRSRIHAHEIFKECMLEELKTALSNEYQEQLSAVLGSEQHHIAKDVIQAYLIASEEVNKSRVIAC